MAWDWEIFCKETTTGEIIKGCLGQGGDQTYLNWLGSAWGWTLTVAMSAMVVAFVMGLIMGALRTLPPTTAGNRWLARLGTVWTELFRNIPVLVQLFIWYFVIPAIFTSLKSVPSVVMVVLGLGFFTSSRVSEQVRSGIESLPKGQRYAAMAMGFSTLQSYRLVLLPMALRIVMPPLTSEAMNIIKNSSVAFAVSIAELTFFARQSGEETSQPVQMYLAVTVLYAVSALTVNRVMNWIEVKTRVPGFVGASAAPATH
ncbi:MAG: glutamate/aspartate transport system permease protein GltJ [Pseudomonadota bacterium]|jgi:glutamate/aspartate transport system permease protein